MKIIIVFYFFFTFIYYCKVNVSLTEQKLTQFKASVDVLDKMTKLPTTDNLGPQPSPAQSSPGARPFVIGRTRTKSLPFHQQLKRCRLLVHLHSPTSFPSHSKTTFRLTFSACTTPINYILTSVFFFLNISLVLIFVWFKKLLIIFRFPTRNIGRQIVRRIILFTLCLKFQIISWCVLLFSS